MKGADQCPKCASRKWTEPGVTSSFYAPDVRVCANCRTLWEPFAAEDVPDPKHEPLGAFRHPCGNCAFRKGSPEQRDPAEFERLRDQLGFLGGSFYCHKGVPIDPADPDGFAYPKDREGKPDTRRMRLCRGYLNQLGKFPLDVAHRALWDAKIAEEAERAEQGEG